MASWRDICIIENRFPPSVTLYSGLSSVAKCHQHSYTRVRLVPPSMMARIPTKFNIPITQPCDADGKNKVLARARSRNLRPSKFFAVHQPTVPVFLEHLGDERMRNFLLQSSPLSCSAPRQPWLAFVSSIHMRCLRYRREYGSDDGNIHTTTAIQVKSTCQSFSSIERMRNKY